MSDIGYALSLTGLKLILTIMAVVWPLMFWESIKGVFSEEK